MDELQGMETDPEDTVIDLKFEVMALMEDMMALQFGDIVGTFLG